MLYQPKTLKLHWTQHVKEKMKYYALSESRIKRVINHPTRTEEGIAPDTIAVMQPITKKMKPSQPSRLRYYGGRNPVPKAFGHNLGNRTENDMLSGTRTTQEIWVMYQDKEDIRTVITAWRYPGQSPLRSPIPIPDEIRVELNIS